MQEYERLRLRDLESELHNNSEDYDNNREYKGSDDDDSLSYIDTSRSSDMPNFTEPTDAADFNCNVSDDTDEEEDYMAIRRLVLYGKKSSHFSPSRF